VAAPGGGAWTLSRVEELVCGALDGLSYGEEVEWTLELKRASFMELGVDSLDAPKFVERCNAAFAPMGVTLRATAIFENACVRDLSQHVLDELKARGLDKPLAHVSQPKSNERGAFKLAPPGDDAFYKRNEVIPYWKLPEITKKMGANNEQARLWVAQRGCRKTVLTIEMLDAVMNEMESECW